MKKYLLIPFLFVASIALGATIKISSLPLGDLATSSDTDSVPYVSAADGATKRFALGDLANTPSLKSYFAPKSNPVFVGGVTAPTFTGNLVGNASTASSLASDPTDCGVATYATGIAANGNLTCSAISNGATSGTPLNSPNTLVLRDGSGNFSAGTITATLNGSASSISGIVPTANGGTGLNSTATFPSSGVVSTTTGSETLTNKTLTTPVINSPTGLVKGDVGLGNVDNTSDATKNAATATLTNKTLTAPVINSPTGLVKADVGLGNVDNTSDATKNAAAVVLTNKDIDGGTAANNRRITLPKNTTANLTALTRKEATIVYDTDVKNILYDNGTDLIPVGSGTGGGGVNYILNPDAEINAQGWATYVNGTGSNPTTGTGGTANVTFTRSTSTPLVGKASFLFSKGAVSRIGEGFSYDFTIPSLSKGQQLAINYGYQILPSSGTFNSGDLKVWIYDVTNARLIQPSAFQVMGSLGPTVAQPLVFQAASDSTSYRLIFHVSTTNAANWDILFDSFSVGHQVVPVGAAVTDWATFVPITTGLGTLGGSTAQWRRNGDSMEITGNIAAGTTSGTDATMALPNSLSANTSGWGSAARRVGTWIRNISSASSRKTGAIVIFQASPTLLYFTDNDYTTARSPFTSTAGSTFLSSGDTISITIDSPLPIQGWSSNTVVSDSAASRKVAATMLKTSGSVSASSVVTNWSSALEDTHGMVNLSTGEITIKVPGSYQFTFTGSVAAADTSIFGPLINGSPIALWTTDGTSYFKNITVTLPNLKVGDIVAVRNGSSGSTTATKFQWSMTLIQGPAQIQAATKIASSYSTASGQSIGASGASTIVNYDSKREDLTGSVTTGAAWRFTAPSPGTFSVKAKAQIAAFSGSAVVYLSIFKNGVEFSRGPITATFATSNTWAASIEDDVPLNEGEYLDIRISNGTTSAALTSTAVANTVAISRNGGVN